MQVDVRIVGRESFGSALQYFTGSKAHAIALRRRARTLGYKLNEYGVFRGTERLARETENGVCPGSPQSCARIAARSPLPSGIRCRS
ncbi:hypothetical protein ACO0TC_16060 [Pseudomonas aeruginosa]|uniref:hypothetical protein n=1 Tax=Pseudomonas aeruginosa TaxID=287 RepID=UPI003BF2A38C